MGTGSYIWTGAGFWGRLRRKRNGKKGRRKRRGGRRRRKLESQTT